MEVISRNLICRPLLARGTKAEGLGLVRFLTVSGHAFSYKAMLLSILRAQIGTRSPSPDPGLWICCITKNPSIFKSVFKVQKTKKAASKASKTQQKSIPKFIKNDFWQKSIVARPSLRKPRFGSPKRRNFGSELVKKQPGHKPEQNEISSILKSKS